MTTHRAASLAEKVAKIERSRAAGKRADGLSHVDREARAMSLIASATRKAESGTPLTYTEHRVLQLLHTATMRMAEEPLA